MTDPYLLALAVVQELTPEEQQDHAGRKVATEGHLELQETRTANGVMPGTLVDSGPPSCLLLPDSCKGT